jgi:hypothetical protein
MYRLKIQNKLCKQIILFPILLLAGSLQTLHASTDGSGDAKLDRKQLASPFTVAPAINTPSQASLKPSGEISVAAFSLMRRENDDEGEALIGANGYVVEIPDEPPADAEWSLTIYKTPDKADLRDGRFMQEIGAITHAERRSLGTPIRIPIRPASAPKRDVKASLLAPEGKFYVILRIYQISHDAPEMDYEPPQIRKVK